MASEKKVALITGCSSGGLGAALAIALQKSGYRVIATARNTKKLAQTDDAGIEHLKLDVISPSSISECVKSLERLTGRLDLLINNAGSTYIMPIVDIDVEEARKVFDLNVFSLITVTRAFLPLLLKSPDARVANNISIAAYVNLPINGTYSASKAAANSMTESMRLELAPFGIKVLALLTGSVKSNFFNNIPGQTSGSKTELPEDSIYRVVPGGLKIMNDTSAVLTEDGDMSAEVWATQVVGDLVKSNPPYQIWKGSYAFQSRIGCHLPLGLFDKQLMKTSKLEELEEALSHSKGRNP